MTRKTIVFDLETDSVAVLRETPPREFFRLAGWTTDFGATTQITDQYIEAAREVATADLAVGHNVIGFDYPALYGTKVDTLRLTRERKIIDTQVLAPTLDLTPDYYVPEGSATGERVYLVDKKGGLDAAKVRRYYRLDECAKRYGHRGKSDDLARLANQHGGYGNIPTDNPEYREYLRGDISATVAVAAKLIPMMDDYSWREMRCAAITTQIGHNGWRLDADECRRTIEYHRVRNGELLQDMSRRYGLPLERVIMGSKRTRVGDRINDNGRKVGVFRSEPYVRRTEPLDSPLATDAGNDVLYKAFSDMGVPMHQCPKTPTGAPSFSTKTLPEFLESVGASAEARALGEAVCEIKSTRTIYGDALESLHPDGRVHPDITMLQRTGRGSVTKPGLTVVGKNNGRHHERRIYLPDDDSHVLRCFDLSQMDARSVAVHCQDPEYFKLFEPGVDGHMEVAHRVFGERTAAARKRAKAIVHGWNYCEGIDALVRNTGLPREVVIEFDKGMRASFPQLIRWREEMYEIACSQGYVENGMGRCIPCSPGREYTQAPANVGQGTTRDVILECALRMDDRVVRMMKGWVHDEFVFSIPKRELEDVTHHVLGAMNWDLHIPGKSRPIRVESDASPVGNTWADCYEKEAA